MKIKRSVINVLVLCSMLLLLMIIVVIRVCPLVRHLGVSRSTDELKEYIITNNEKLTSFSQELYSIQDNNIIIYDSYEELPASSTAIWDPFVDMRILYIAVEKDTHDMGDRVFFILKDRPDDKRYYNSGFYYSPTGTISDLYGNAKEGDYFEHDGGQTGERSRYRTEKICDNWYYFEEAVW